MTSSRPAAPAASRSSRWLSVAIIGLFGLTVALFCLTKVWSHDAVEYAFVVPEDYTHNPYERIESFTDILRSQQHHYSGVNSRVTVHVAVQYFCALGGRPLFAVADGLVAIAFILLLLRLGGASWRNPAAVLSASLLAWMYLITFFFDPPYQIGYLWVPTLISLFILLFFRAGKSGSITLVLPGILGFVAGQAHEGFSAGIVIGLAAILVQRRFRFSTRQWIMAAAFALGVATHMLSGGNMTRMAGAEQRHWLTIPLYLLRFIPMLYVYGAVLLWRRGCRLPLTSLHLKGNLWVWATAGYMAVLAFTGVIYAFSCAPANFFLLILTIQALPRHRLRGGMLLAVALITTGLLCLKGYSQYQTNRKYSHIRSHYLTSPHTGLVVLPYDLYAYDDRPMRERYVAFEWEARSVNPHHAPLRVYPQGLERIPPDLDTNMVIPFGRAGLIAIQSRRHPRPMVLRHRIGPLTWTRTLTFRPDDLDFVDTTAAWSAVTYINPLPELKPVSIEIGEP